MARRMSNRDRIDRMREEAAAKEKEKAKKAKEPRANARGATKPAAPAGRMKLVWAVADPGGRVVTTYPYPHKTAAEAEAKRLTTKDGRQHFVRSEKVPMD